MTWKRVCYSQGQARGRGVWRSRREEDQKTDPDGWSSVSPPHSLKHSTGKRPLAEKDCYENPGAGGRETPEPGAAAVVGGDGEPIPASDRRSFERPFGSESVFVATWLCEDMGTDAALDVLHLSCEYMR